MAASLEGLQPDIRTKLRHSSLSTMLHSLLCEFTSISVVSRTHEKTLRYYKNSSLEPSRYFSIESRQDAILGSYSLRKRFKIMPWRRFRRHHGALYARPGGVLPHLGGLQGPLGPNRGDLGLQVCARAASKAYPGAPGRTLDASRGRWLKKGPQNH